MFSLVTPADVLLCGLKWDCKKFVNKRSLQVGLISSHQAGGNPHTLTWSLEGHVLVLRKGTSKPMME